MSDSTGATAVQEVASSSSSLPPPTSSSLDPSSSQVDPASTSSAQAQPTATVAGPTPASATKKRGGQRRKGPLQVNGEEPASCPACVQEESAAAAQRALAAAESKKKEIWVECDKCQTWYHWTCIAPNKTDTPELIDKWYCKPCVTLSLSTPYPLVTTQKPPPRKSSRPSTSRTIDYANLDSHIPADASRWLRVLDTKETVNGNECFRKMKAEEITNEWIWGEGTGAFDEPFLIEQPQGLGMKMPPADMSIQEIAKVVGPKTPIEVIDVASQSSLSHWTLQQWADYYTDPNRDKVRNVISLEVSESKLGPKVIAPEVVRKLDWVDTIWPNSMKGPGEFPTVQKYCLMSVARCWTDWHVDFAGSSVFYHILRGQKVFYFIRPTAANLAAYERWSGSAERQETTWLGDDVDQVFKVELTAGNTMIIPTGWPHAVYTPCDTLVFGGNFLHSLNIGTQLRIYAIELATKVPRKFRFPHFVKLLWFVANHYTARLASILPIPTLSAVQPPPPKLPMDMSNRVLDGLKELSSFLVEQSSRMPKDAPVSAERRRIARENVPWAVVSDPAALARQLRILVLRARGESLDDECFEPVATVKQEEGKVAPSPGVHAGAETRSGQKRKAESPVRETNSLRLKIPNQLSVPTTNGNGKHHSNGHASALAPKGLPSNDGQILSRVVMPVTSSERREPRSDPARLDLGAVTADVKTSETTTTVVRRIEEPGGGVVLETRSVVTQVERVRWPAPGETAPPTKVRLVAPGSKGAKEAPKPPPFDQHAPPRPLQFAPLSPRYHPVPLPGYPHPANGYLHPGAYYPPPPPGYPTSQSYPAYPAYPPHAMYYGYPYAPPGPHAHSPGPPAHSPTLTSAPQHSHGRRTSSANGHSPYAGSPPTLPGRLPSGSPRV